MYSNECKAGNICKAIDTICRDVECSTVNMICNGDNKTNYRTSIVEQ